MCCSQEGSNIFSTDLRDIQGSSSRRQRARGPDPRTPLASYAPACLLTTSSTSWHIPAKRQQNERPPADAGSRSAYGDLLCAARRPVRSYAHVTSGASGYVIVVSRASEIVLASVNNLANLGRRRRRSHGALGEASVDAVLLLRRLLYEYIRACFLPARHESPCVVSHTVLSCVSLPNRE